MIGSLHMIFQAMQGLVDHGENDPPHEEHLEPAVAIIIHEVDVHPERKPNRRPEQATPNAVYLAVLGRLLRAAAGERAFVCLSHEIRALERCAAVINADKQGLARRREQHLASAPGIRDGRLPTSTRARTQPVKIHSTQHVFTARILEECSGIIPM